MWKDLNVRAIFFSLWKLMPLQIPFSMHRHFTWWNRFWGSWVLLLTWSGTNVSQAMMNSSMSTHFEGNLIYKNNSRGTVYGPPCNGHPPFYCQFANKKGGGAVPLTIKITTADTSILDVRALLILRRVAGPLLTSPFLLGICHNRDVENRFPKIEMVVNYLLHLYWVNYIYCIDAGVPSSNKLWKFW